MAVASCEGAARASTTIILLHGFREPVIFEAQIGTCAHRAAGLAVSVPALPWTQQRKVMSQPCSDRSGRATATRSTGFYRSCTTSFVESRAPSWPATTIHRRGCGAACRYPSRASRFDAPRRSGRQPARRAALHHCPHCRISDRHRPGRGHRLREGGAAHAGATLAEHPRDLTGRADRHGAAHAARRVSGRGIVTDGEESGRP